LGLVSHLSLLTGTSVGLRVASGEKFCGGLKVVSAGQSDIDGMDELQEFEDFESLDFSHDATGTSEIERKIDLLPFGLEDQDVIESLNCIPLVRLRSPQPPSNPVAGTQMRLTHILHHPHDFQVSFRFDEAILVFQNASKRHCRVLRALPILGPDVPGGEPAMAASPPFTLEQIEGAQTGDMGAVSIVVEAGMKSPASLDSLISNLPDLPDSPDDLAQASQADPPEVGLPHLSAMGQVPDMVAGDHMKETVPFQSPSPMDPAHVSNLSQASHLPQTMEYLQPMPLPAHPFLAPLQQQLNYQYQLLIATTMQATTRIARQGVVAGSHERDEAAMSSSAAHPADPPSPGTPAGVSTPAGLSASGAGAGAPTTPLGFGDPGTSPIALDTTQQQNQAHIPHPHFSQTRDVSCTKEVDEAVPTTTLTSASGPSRQGPPVEERESAQSVATGQTGSVEHSESGEPVEPGGASEEKRSGDEPTSRRDTSASEAAWSSPKTGEAEAGVAWERAGSQLPLQSTSTPRTSLLDDKSRGTVPLGASVPSISSVVGTEARGSVTIDVTAAPVLPPRGSDLGIPMPVAGPLAGLHDSVHSLMDRLEHTEDHADVPGLSRHQAQAKAASASSEAVGLDPLLSKGPSAAARDWPPAGEAAAAASSFPEEGLPESFYPWVSKVTSLQSRHHRRTTMMKGRSVGALSMDYMTPAAK
jgi:hypothetical protein